MKHSSGQRGRFTRLLWLLASLFVTGVAFAAENTESPSWHWAFRSLRRPTAPAVKDSSQVRSPVDRFVQAKLEARGLTLSPEAEKTTLIRRVAFDLTGLPPAPSDVAD